MNTTKVTKLVTVCDILCGPDFASLLIWVTVQSEEGNVSNFDNRRLVTKSNAVPDCSKAK